MTRTRDEWVQALWKCIAYSDQVSVRYEIADTILSAIQQAKDEAVEECIKAMRSYPIFTDGLIGRKIRLKAKENKNPA